ncbi:MAG: signal recognition particle protein, partial [Chloroflexi bacterium]
MFDSLSDRLTSALRKLSGRGVLRPEDVEATLREVRMALLEADVNYKVVHDELVEMLGANTEGLRWAPAPPTLVMLAGVQGSGKTTTAVKLALWARRQGRQPMVVALDLRRPAAIDQLRVLAKQEQVDFHSGSGAVETIAREAVAEAR